METPNVNYEYTMANNWNEIVIQKDVFYWDYTDWTHCSKSCGKGTQYYECKLFIKAF